MGEECEKWQRYIGENVSLAVWPLAGPMVPAIVERDEKVFRETKPVGELVENHAKVVQAISPLIESIKEGGYIKGETLHYTEFGLGSIFV
jgi:hypothetical protein